MVDRLERAMGFNMIARHGMNVGVVKNKLHKQAKGLKGNSLDNFLP